ncbi:hypothetical protein ACQKP5_02090 [Pseudomonas vancouverensis]|uniref:hypothetical protein n=1 Tax=Pseudomonas vancouverensis TaxID=95300 RepID=UPI003CFC8395
MSDLDTPVYSGVLKATDLPESLKDGVIYDQASLENAWSSIQERWRTETPTEEHFVQLLGRGIKQLDTYKALAPLIKPALLRLINTLENTPERPEEFVNIICDLPTTQWANAFGEDFKLPSGYLYGFVQAQVTRSHLEQWQMRDAGELLGDAPWKAVRELTESVRLYVPSRGDRPINDYLSQLEDWCHVRPSLMEARTLVSGLVQALEETSLDVDMFWPQSLVVAAQSLSKRLAAIEIVDNRPDRSWLEEVVDPQALQAALSKVATPMNSALTKLGAMSLSDIGNELKGGIKTALTTAANHLFSDARAESVSEQQVDSAPVISELLTDMLDIERKSSFYNDVITTGPRYTGGVSGKLVYVLNALHTTGLLDLAEKARPYLPAVPMPPPVVFAPEPAEVPPVSGAELLDKAQRLGMQVQAFVASAPTPPVAGKSEDVGPLPVTQKAQPVVSWTFGGLDVEQMSQAMSDLLRRIDDALTFPSAAATDTEELENMLRKAVEEGEAIEEVLERHSLYRETLNPPTVEDSSSPSWRETIAHLMHGVLSKLSTAIATGTVLVLEKAATGAQLVKDNPGATVATVFVSSAALLSFSGLYGYFSNDSPSPSAQPLKTGDTFPDTTSESPAQREEHLEDDLERILAANVTLDQPPLLQTILARMLESAEHNLLDDSHLIDDVAQLLEQHSLQSPQKTFVELIQELPLHAHALKTASPVPAAEPAVSSRVKRDTEYASADVDPDDMQGDISTLSPDIEVEESEPARLARLTDYLKVMGELQGNDAEAVSEIEESTDDAIGSARLVVRVLRQRRAATWVDTSRAAGDRQLVEGYANELSRYAEGEVSYSSATVAVPVHSTFGESWLNFVSAIKNPFFIDWASRVNLDLSTVKILTASGELSGRVKGVLTKFTLYDGSGWDNVAGPILKAARVVDPTCLGVAYPSGGTTPLALVSSFHAEPSTPTQSQARLRAQQLKTNQAFTQISPDDPLRPQEARFEAEIEKQRQYLGDIYTHHSLITALTALIKDKPAGASINLDTETFFVHKDSLFANKHPQEARQGVTAQRFFSAMGWNVPKTAGEIHNLIEALSFALPESSPMADYKGALGYGQPLSTAQVQTIRETVQSLEKTTVGGLLNTLLKSQTFTTPAQGLDIALNNPEAIELGTTLESKLKAIKTPGSATEWVMAALLLDLDPTPGQPRNHVAGYNLTQAANWGASPTTVVNRLQAHLRASGKVSATAAPVAAYHLLAAFAPEFLVRNIPDNLVCGSHTWASFRIAVARIEQIDPGATRQMTFEQIMDYGSTDPISTGQEIAVQSASVDPLIDWAITNGVLVANATDTYTPGQLKIAGEKFDNVRMEMAKAQASLTAQMPTREGLALAELERVFGKGLPFEDKCLQARTTSDSPPQIITPPQYSMLDIYITGRFLPGRWDSHNTQIPIERLAQKFLQLKPVESYFKGAFTAYFDNLQSGSESIFKNLVSQLPLDDRESLEYGVQRFYSVRSAIDKEITDQTPEDIEAHKGRHGILIQSTYKGKITYYEVFPDAVRIQKNTKLPNTLKLNGQVSPITDDSYPYAQKKKQIGTSQPIDWAAYEKGSAPRSDVTSNVIIEEIKPIIRESKRKSPEVDANKVPNAFSPTSRIDFLAKVAVKEHFIVGRDTLESLARGSTDSKNDQALMADILKFFSDLVPFKSCVDNISQGKVGAAVLDCTLDAAGFLIPGGIAAGKAIKVAKTAGKFVPKVMKITWIMSSSLVSSANPLDGVGDLYRFGKNVVVRLGTTAQLAANAGVEQIRKLYGTSKAMDPEQLLKRADIAQGISGTGLSSQTSPIKALFKDDNWYAYDVAGNRPYGPPLENFRPASAIPLERTTFSDGSSAFTPSVLFDTEAHVIQRSSCIDIVVADKVYRYDPKLPDTLTDISSPIYFKEAEGFEAVCQAGRRPKRSPKTCFTKIVKSGGTAAEKRAQAIQHKRLYPTRIAAGEVRKLFHERRLFTVADTGQTQKLLPLPLAEPVHTRAKTTGVILDDKHFGLPDKEVDTVLDSMTRPIRVDGVIHGLDDQRDVRAFIVNYNHQNSGAKDYLVAEAETGLFYYCDYDPTSTSNLALTRIDNLNSNSLGNGLIKAHDGMKDQILRTAGTPINRDFVALPHLDSLYMDLVLNKKFTPDQINKLKAKTALLSAEKQREFVLNVWNKGNRRTVEIALPTIKVEPIQKPHGFNRLPPADQNKVYSDEAKGQVNRQFEATGLKSANQVIPHQPDDLQRQVLTRPVVIWEYSRIGAPNYADIILRTGAGNCDQMAWAAAKIIEASGGTATIWNMPGAHTFTLVGVPRGTATKTINFSEPVFKDAWIVDPWAEISCKASEYITLLEFKMISWNLDKKQLLMTDWLSPTPASDWKSPEDPLWIAQIIHGEKIPS